VGTVYAKHSGRFFIHRLHQANLLPDKGADLTTWYNTLYEGASTVTLWRRAGYHWWVRSLTLLNALLLGWKRVEIHHQHQTIV
jgi:hypothetical protein